MREIIKNNHGKSGISDTYIIENIETSDPTLIANGFCDYFTHIGPDLSNKILPSKQSYNHYMTKIIPTTDISMFLTPTDAQEVRSVIKTLRPKRSSGPDNISSWLIKQLSDVISEPLATLINKSMETGCMPDALRSAKIIPLYKSKETDQFKNYRPISLLPSISKIFEKIVYKRLYHFIKSKLSSKQYGFQAKRSTIQAVTELC